MSNLEERFSTIDVLTTSGKKHIVLLYGGMSVERKVSLSSGKAVAQALIASGYQVTCVDVGIDIALKLHEIKKIDLVFNCLHGTIGEDGCIPGLLNIMKIPYTHSGVTASAIAFDKYVSKTIFQCNGIKTPESVVITKADNMLDDPMPRPYVVKPLQQGSSIGVDVIFPEDIFLFGDHNFKFGDEVLIEKYIKGRELQIAVLDGKALGILQLKMLKGKRFYDYESKYTEGFAKHIMPALLPMNITKQVLQIAEKTYKVLNCRGLCRVECILSDLDNEVYVIELNTHPGMTSLSICPEIAKYVGIDFNKLVEKILITAQYD